MDRRVDISEEIQSRIYRKGNLLQLPLLEREAKEQSVHN